MKLLDFENITGGMQVLYALGDNIYATTVIETSLGHPSIPMVRLKGGFNILYGSLNKRIYADNPTNRTQLLLEDENILTDLNTE
jgi:hypothetical protein